MSVKGADRSLQEVLDWAMDRMKSAGYPVSSKVSIVSDPDLTIMGYAKEERGTQYIVVADWALDSEMLGGLVLHELSHVYSTEKNAPSHRRKTVENVLVEIADKEGLNERETGYLVDAFNHLQNIIVDDIVFKAMSENELRLTAKFFTEWVTPQPTGDATIDAALLVRNAFAIASLKRRKLYEEDGEMATDNAMFLASLGERASGEFRWLESFLEGARTDWDEQEFRSELRRYLEKIISVMRENPTLRDLR